MVLDAVGLLRLILRSLWFPRRYSEAEYYSEY